MQNEYCSDIIPKKELTPTKIFGFIQTIRRGQLDPSGQDYCWSKVVIGGEFQHIWLGNPYWGGFSYRHKWGKDKQYHAYTNIHLQALLGCLGANWRIRARWFVDTWRKVIMLPINWR